MSATITINANERIALTLSLTTENISPNAAANTPVAPSVTKPVAIPRMTKREFGSGENKLRHQELLREVVEAETIPCVPWPAKPDTMQGRGIVICGGGAKYLPGVYVLLRRLYDLGCRLPVELWHLNGGEIPPAWQSVFDVAQSGCKKLPPALVNVQTFPEYRKFPPRILNGWELKPYSIIHSDFAEVLFLDADNVPLVDPTYLFETPQYKQTGAIFWPDRDNLAMDRPIWRLAEVPYRDEPEVESGQMVIDKGRCWRALQVTMHMNEYSDFWYQHVHGDKETFHFAWRRLQRAYSMPAKRPEALGVFIDAATGHVLCQHDFTGRRIFQHRTGCKYRLDGENMRIAGFQHEAECLAIIEELKGRLK